ncbi:MAG: glycosyltransferase family 4 protein [Hyphomicrobiales bacterium]
MRVLMFGWEFPPHITGGLGTACYGLTKGLVQQDVEVIFVVPKAYGDEDSKKINLINASDVSVDLVDSPFKEYWKSIKYLEVPSGIIPYVSPDAYALEELNWNVTDSKVFSKNYQFSGKYTSNLLEEVARYALISSAIAAHYPHDVIHAHDWLTYPAGIAAAKVSGKPLVVHMHATEFDRSGENINQTVFDMERDGMLAADRVVAVSNFTKSIVVDRYGIPEEKVVTVHNAVEPIDNEEKSKASRLLKEKIVTFLGRVTFQKGPDYFVEAARKILNKDPNIRFVMAGRGDMLNKMIRRVAELGMGDKFHFTGFLKGKEVDKLFSITDVFVMPSVSEPFGIVPLEAIRSKVPVVISKQSGVSEILTHALKVDFWDIDALADSIYGLCHYDALSEMFQKYGKAEVDNLKWENSAFKIKNVYSQLIDN